MAPNPTEKAMRHRFDVLALVASLPLLACAASVPRPAAPEPPHAAFFDALRSGAAARDRAEKLGLYAFLIGDWDARIVAFSPDGARHESRGEIHADWVLEGRAIQDVWITPPRAERPAEGAPLPPLPVTGAWFGTTLRVYDPTLDAWHILWSDPATQFYAQQLGRADEEGIVQEGTLPSGAVLRWRFSEITQDSFHWQGSVSRDGGASWRTQVEVFASRSGETARLRGGPPSLGFASLRAPEALARVGRTSSASLPSRPR